MTLQLAELIIAAVQQLMGLMSTSSQTVQIVTTVINLLEKLLPLIVDFVPSVYTAIKNIIIELKADPATTQAQWDVLDSIDTQLDAANDAAIAAVDPDAPAAPT